MKVVSAPSAGGPDALAVQHHSTPIPGHDEVLIAVVAAGVNRADILQREGLYPPPAGAPSWLGLEVSGVVQGVGSAVTNVSSGDQVCALLPGGGYAEYAAVHSTHVAPVPPGMGLIDAGALMEAACTVWSAMDSLGASKGQRILIHGGSGGIGTLAIQIAKAMGLWVATTAGGAHRTARCVELGADLAIDYRSAPFHTIIAEAGGVDLVLDILGAGALEDNLACLRPDGAMLIIGLQQGTRGTIPLATLLAKRLTIVGTSLRSRSIEDKARIVRAVIDEVWPLIPHAVAPVIHARLPLDDAAVAHRMVESGEVFGKVVLTTGHDA